jgi:Flp pilus assembly protein protease CpaA
MTYMLILFALPISIADMKEHKIPNIYLLLMFWALTPILVLFGLGDLYQLCVFLSVITLLHVLGMGMGDFKLLSIIGLALNATGRDQLQFFTFSILLCASLHLLLYALFKRSLPDRIALAPSIFVGLSLYLATR